MHFARKSEQLDRQIARLETELEELSAGRGVADVRGAATGPRHFLDVHRAGDVA